MKAALLQLGVLVLLFWAICSVDTAPRPATSAAATATDADGWRRTVDGWEQRTQWATAPSRTAAHPCGNIAAVHPLNIAALQALLSIGALLLMSPGERPKINSPQPANADADWLSA